MISKDSSDNVDSIYLTEEDKSKNSVLNKLSLEKIKGSLKNPQKLHKILGKKDMEQNQNLLLLKI